MPQAHEQLSTLTTLHRNPSHHAVLHRPAGPSIHVSPTPRIITSSAYHTPSQHHHGAITGLATEPRPTATKATASDSAGAPFTYPTPSSVPHNFGTILGLSIAIGLLLALLLLGAVLYFMHRRAEGRKPKDDEIELTKMASEVPAERTVAGREYQASVMGRPGKVRTWYGRRVPSGWI